MQKKKLFLGFYFILIFSFIQHSTKNKTFLDSRDGTEFFKIGKRNELRNQNEDTSLRREKKFLSPFFCQVNFFLDFKLKKKQISTNIYSNSKIFFFLCYPRHGHGERVRERHTHTHAQIHFQNIFPLSTHHNCDDTIQSSSLFSYSKQFSLPVFNKPASSSQSIISFCCRSVPLSLSLSLIPLIILFTQKRKFFFSSSLSLAEFLPSFSLFR